MAYVSEGNRTYCSKITVKTNGDRVFTEDVYGVQQVSVGKNASLVATGVQMFRGTSWISISSDSLFEAECVDASTAGGKVKISVGKNSSFTVTDGMTNVTGFSCKDSCTVNVSGDFTGAGTDSTISLGANVSASFAEINFRNASGAITVGSDSTFSAENVRGLNRLTVKGGTTSTSGSPTWSNVNLGAVTLRGSASVKIGDFSQVYLRGLTGGKSVSLKIGTNSTFDSSDRCLCNVSSMKVASGTVYFEDSGVVQGYTTIYADAVTGTSGSNTYAIGDFCSVSVSNIDFVGGSWNKLTLGIGSQLFVSVSGTGAGSVSKVNKLTLQDGSSVDRADMTVSGDLGFIGSAALTLGAFSYLSVGQNVTASSSLSIAVGPYAQLNAGDVSNVKKLVLTGGSVSVGTSGQTLQRTSVCFGSVTGTKNSDSWTINENCDLNIAGVDFGGGTNNTLNLAANSTLYVLSANDSTGSVNRVKSVVLADGSAQRNAFMTVDGGMTFSDKVKGTLTVGKCASFIVLGDVCAGSKGTLTVKVGSSANFEAGSLQGLYSWTVSGGASSRSGYEILQEYTLVQVGDVVGTDKDNSYQFGSHCNVTTGNIDFVGGKANRLAFGSGSTVRTGDISGVNQLAILSGSVSRSSGGIDYATLNIDGDLNFYASSKNYAAMNIGSYVKVTIGGNVACDFVNTGKTSSSLYVLSGSYYGYGYAEVKTGAHSDFVVLGDFSSSVNVSTGKNCRVGLNSTMYKTFVPRTFEGYIYHILDGSGTVASGSSNVSGRAYPILSSLSPASNFDLGDGSVMYDLGTERQIVHFTDFDDELLDNKLNSMVTQSSGFSGWLSADGAGKQKITETTSFAEYSYVINYYDDLTDFCKLTGVTAGQDTSSLNGWKVLSDDSDLLNVRVHLKSGNDWTTTDVTCNDGVWDLGAAVSDAVLAAAADYRIEISVNDKTQQGDGGVAVYQLKK